MPGENGDNVSPTYYKFTDTVDVESLTLLPPIYKSFHRWMDLDCSAILNCLITRDIVNLTDNKKYRPSIIACMAITAEYRLSQFWGSDWCKRGLSCVICIGADAELVNLANLNGGANPHLVDFTCSLGIHEKALPWRYNLGTHINTGYPDLV